MKTEISRDSHQPKKRYSGVYQQQGRMLTDADWNELVEILKERLNDALKVLCDRKPGGSCAVTVGEGGTYSTLEAAFNSEEFKKKSRIAICLLPGPRPHSIEKLDVSGKQSISITGHGAVILVHGQLSLEAGNVTLRGIHFSVIDKVSTGTGSITLSSPNGGNVVVEHCRFNRVFNGTDATWRPLVTVGKLTILKWAKNDMYASRQYEEIRSATNPEREAIPEASLEAYDALKAVWRMDPYDDPGAFEARATAVAEKISGLTSATREKWYAKRPVSRINRLPNKPIRIWRPSIEGGRLERTPGRGRLEPIPGRVTPRSLPGVTARLARLAVVSEVSPRGEVKKFFELLKSAEAIDVTAMADAIHTVAELVNRFDYALALESNDVRGWITNNDFSGYVALHNNQDKAVPLSWASTETRKRIKNKKTWAEERLDSDLSAKYQLSLHGNGFTAVHSMIPQDTLNTIHEILDLDTGEIPPITIQAYDSLTVRDNIFYEGNNSFISNFLNVSGNQFPNSAGKGKSVVAYTLGFSGVFLGSQALGRINAIIEQILHQKVKAANLLRIV